MNYSSLARLLGLSDQGTPLSYLTGMNRLGKDYLDSLEGAAPAYESYATNLGRTNGALGNLARRYAGRIEDRYRAASAEDNTLTRTQFLERFNPQAFRKSLTTAERGENPAAYLGRYKYARN